MREREEWWKCGEGSCSENRKVVVQERSASRGRVEEYIQNMTKEEKFMYKEDKQDRLSILNCVLKRMGREPQKGGGNLDKIADKLKIEELEGEVRRLSNETPNYATKTPKCSKKTPNCARRSTWRSLEREYKLQNQSGPLWKKGG